MTLASKHRCMEKGVLNPLWVRTLIVLPLLAILLATTGPHLLSWATARRPWGAEAQAYRYRFQRPPRGSVKRALENEIAFYQRRIGWTPDSGLDRAALAGTYLRMARATGDLRWYLLAEETARQSLAHLSIHNPGAIMVLARVAEARHDFDEAIRLARTAGASGEALSIIVTSNLAMGNVDAAGRAAEKLVGASPSVQSYALRALVEIARGEDAQAYLDFRRALAAEEPEEVASSTWVRTLYGRFHYQRGRLALAHELYDEALRILPQYPLALVNLAELEMRQGQYAAAEDHLTRVVTISAASPNIYDHVVLRGLARVKELQGRAEEARRFWDEAEARLRRDITSGKFGHRRELARLLLTRGRPEDLTEALALLQTELKVRRDPDTLDAMAWALSRAGRWQEAQQAIQQALRRGIRDVRLFYRAGTIEQALGHAAQAQMYFQLVRSTDPTFDERARQVAGVGL